ncbi:hypothetical protein SAMN05421821_105175 [Mucilaginibacter lappiensis]|uniref:Single-stranded DNA-binding protein n=1 Tax=Mucilaginibacter lappiensis TaxID=354630 RepID=A0ABR6PJ00_9SPHI|nr:hypothetical protein [Mucilaginibacter lappiensis]MBB6109757.1 hypothetical protein [Mucilaginibacter lappiensis]SIR14509.1 hypothetical protein SAMN05421821_105175 [Mucilaginibacter lappiensis]
MSIDKDLSGSIALTKLVHVMMDAKGKNGPVRGIFIPIGANLLLEKEKAIYMSVKVKVKEEADQFGQNGFISKTTDTNIWKGLNDAQKEEAKKLSPILGNIKDWSTSVNDTAGAASTETFTDDDDLPF